MPELQHIVVVAIMLASPWCMVWLWRRDVFRPGSLSRLEASGRLRNAAAIGAGAWLAASVATYIAAIVGAGLAAAALGLPTEPGVKRDPGDAAVADVITYVFAGTVGVVCAGLLARGGRGAGATTASLGLESRGGDAWAGLGALVVVLPLCVTVGVAVSMLARLVHEEPPRIAHSALREMVDNRHAWHAWVKALMAVVGAPVVEELVYRVFLQSAIISALSRLRAAGTGEAPVVRGRDVFIGIALSTAGFVLPHAMALGGPATWNALPTLVILGAALGVVYERTKSPLAVIVMHAGFNAVNVIAAMATTPAAA
jgi:membrane protease YdiL (CAAX protease family)